ncbi:MAG: sulfatase-like hydrolase/transferase [Planctomycetota bacterium]|jgi:arylsulfatase A-like enzyme
MNHVALGDKKNVTSGGLLGSVIAVFVSVGVVANVGGWSPQVRASEAAGGQQAEVKQPNILILMTDHGRADVVTAQSQCLTPNLDRLATEGVRFGRCYTPNGMCSPARASLMTATYPSTHGVWDCTHTQREAWVDVAPELVHWAQQLSAAGYRTGYFGKWHLTQSKKLEDYGWQEYDFGASKRSPRVAGTEVVSRREGYRDIVIAAVGRDDAGTPHHPVYDRGIDFIRRHASGREPFCCFLSTSEPGAACVPPKRFLDMYDPVATRVSPSLHDDLAGKSQMLRRMQSAWQDMSEEDWRTVTTHYMAVMTFLDSEIGRILQVLRDAGCYDDTIICYLSDHGRMLGAHGLAGLGLGLAYEETYRVPLIIRIPDRLLDDSADHRGRDVDDALVSLVDVGPTLLDLCRLGPFPQAQGRSLRPLIEDRADKNDWQDAYGEFFGQRFMFTQRIVWHGDWKYIFSPGGVDELYDLADDPHELVNLADDPQHRDILIDMTKRMWRKMLEIGDESLLNSHYNTLRTAPIGPNAVLTEE